MDASERNYTVKTIWRDMSLESMEVAKIFSGFGTLSCDQNDLLAGSTSLLHLIVIHLILETTKQTIQYLL